MDRDQTPISEEAARAIWRRAAQLQAEAERRMEEGFRRLPDRSTGYDDAVDGLHPDEVRAAAEEAGISPEFVQIALAEASASGGSASAPISRRDRLGARLFLGARRDSIEVSSTVKGSVDSVTEAVIRVFSGHPCLLHAGEVAELPAGRVLVFRVPKYDWNATANLPFVEKAAAVGLKQVQVVVRPFPVERDTCEVLVVADLNPGMRSQWRWSAATATGAAAVGGFAAWNLAAATVAGALLALPAAAGAVTLGGVSAFGWSLAYRAYRAAVRASLEESVQLLPATLRAVASTRRDDGSP